MKKSSESFEFPFLLISAFILSFAPIIISSLSGFFLKSCLNLIFICIGFPPLFSNAGDKSAPFGIRPLLIILYNPLDNSSFFIIGWLFSSYKTIFAFGSLLKAEYCIRFAGSI